MSSDEFASDYVKLQPEPPPARSPEKSWIFDELPAATIVSVSRPDASDITPVLLSYTIEFQYKQFKWRLLKKASQVIYLHFALKKRAFVEELHEKQEHVKEWLQNLGIGEHTEVVQHDEVDEESVPIQHEENIYSRTRNVPSSAALSIIRPALGRQSSISDRAKMAMQGYLNHFLGNLDIANSQEVCKFLEVSRLSFLPEYGPKLKEDYVTVRHLPKIQRADDDTKCCACYWFSCCNSNWQRVWAVLKPGFLALLEDPFNPKLLDIIVFDVLPPSDRNGDGRVLLAKETKERNPLWFGFTVSCGNRTIKLRVRSSAKVKDWVVAINDAGLRAPGGWCLPHCFGSFAPPRGLTEDGSQVQWFVDGQAAFGAIASSIEVAKSEIFITGWWLCPELYLRRPFHVHASSRLDSLLEAKAKQGVQIYILLYKEVAIALKINSIYSKRRLLNIHENVKVLRYPDHFSTGVYLWSHHEKIVIVDNQICYLGGLDLCFGRYDNPEHRVGDFPPTIWPGKDYYNPRESEPNSWEDTMKDELDRLPWHDVQCALWGPPCRDIARHFVQRWNYAKRNKAQHEHAIPLLMPQHHMVIPHYMGKSKDNDVEHKQLEPSHKDVKSRESFCSLSSYQDIPLLLPQEPDGLLVANSKVNGNLNHSHLDHRSRSNHISSISLRKTKEEQSVPDKQLKAFVDDLGLSQTQSETRCDMISQSTADKEWWESQERGDQAFSIDEAGQVGPRTPCCTQVLRSVGQWSAGTSQTEESIHNAYCSLIERAEHFIYIENQFFISGLSGDDIIKNRILEALYRRIMRAEKENKCFRVIIVIPLVPGFQGGIDDGGAATVRAIMHWQYRTICRGPNSILQNLYDIMGQKAHDYISFYGLRSYGRLCDGGPLATNLVYVHSKLMIVDDRMVLIGSANINDRSLLGSRDSEIGVIIEDKDSVGSFMNGRPWRAGKFALSLRLSLWSEHLGLRPQETNTMIYQDVFACVPNDLIHSRSSIRQSMSYWKEKLGHTTIDLGIAPEKLEPYQNGDVTSNDPFDRLQSVRGHLVCFPLDFMCQEDLRPFFNESEFYASPQVFY
ncbi:phospholipase D zeta 1-like isoform X2 [Asparagus officinalis]|uniref:phospholipase D zeta 1-like isoform X2 n=1 Tax=Asparagus officinalis TaxID=4686 RepID=UPI00098DFE5D|nr:phospholipase D zeta 1-like isoform X2 [Asparagus officinalis]